MPGASGSVGGGVGGGGSGSGRWGKLAVAMGVASLEEGRGGMLRQGPQVAIFLYVTCYKYLLDCLVALKMYVIHLVQTVIYLQHNAVHAHLLIDR